jgi:hypothetical protein
MSAIIATLLASSKVVPQTGVGLRGQNRHAYDELVALQAAGDPTIESPYLLASANSVMSATTNASSGNITVTLNFPKSGVAVTTGNIAYNAAVATIQTAIDSALAGEVIVATYVADDVKVSGAGVMSGNAITVTANGTTVNGADMVVTTANVDLDAMEQTVVAGVVGTQNRSAEGILALYGAVAPASVPTPQGSTPSDGDYELGGNPLSLSPGLQDLLVREVEMAEDRTIGEFIRSVVGCV